MVDLRQAAEMILRPLGYEVLELAISGQGAKRRVLLRIDRLDEQVVSMEDVTLATQVFGLELDRLDPFDSPYSLEVESPGSERPLITARHFQRFHDLLAKVKASDERFSGIIRKVEGEQVSFEVGGELKTYAIANISAKLAEWPKEPR